MNDNKCKVLEFLGGSLTDGGAETLVKDYVQLLNKEKFEVAVLVDYVIEGTANQQRLKTMGTKIYSVYPRYSLFWRAVDKFFREPFMSYRVKKILKTYSPDTIHVHLKALHFLYNARECLKKGSRLFYTCHSEVYRYLNNTDNKVEWDAARVLVKDYGLRMIGLRPDMVKELNSLFQVDSSLLIRNGINMDAFRKVEESKTDIRKSLGIPADSFVLGHVGRFFPLKNHDFLLDVFNEVKKKNPKAFLLLVGSGELKEKIVTKITTLSLTQSVLILSNRPDIPRLMKAMDVFVLPSLVEGFGIVLVEAQAAGLRCIASTAVPEEAYLTSHVLSLSLEESASSWAEKILDSNANGGYPEKLDEYDMKKEILRLEDLYSGKA